MTMQPKLSTWLPVIAVLALSATPALTQTQWYRPYGTPPGFYYQDPDGTYASYADVVRALHGTPCGIECTESAAVRWGLVPPSNPYRPYR